MTDVLPGQTLHWSGFPLSNQNADGSRHDENLEIAGDRVVFNGASQSQIGWGSNEDPRPFLTEGAVYVVEKVEVHSWHTKLWIDGRGPFNASSFTRLADPDVGEPRG